MKSKYDLRLFFFAVYILVNASAYLFQHFSKELVLQQDFKELRSLLRQYARLNTGHFFCVGAEGGDTSRYSTVHILYFGTLLFGKLRQTN